MSQSTHQLSCNSVHLMCNTHESIILGGAFGFSENKQLMKYKYIVFRDKRVNLFAILTATVKTNIWFPDLVLHSFWFSCTWNFSILVVFILNTPGAASINIFGQCALQCDRVWMHGVMGWFFGSWPYHDGHVVQTYLFLFQTWEWRRAPFLFFWAKCVEWTSPTKSAPLISWTCKFALVPTISGET